ncbi:MAG: heme oxygenase, partial [Synechococcaceae cyanobacterium]
ILARHNLPPLAFWSFATPTDDLKHALHAGFEQLELLEAEEQELLEEAEMAFRLTQRLLAELETLA